MRRLPGIFSGENRQSVALPDSAEAPSVSFPGKKRKNLWILLSGIAAIVCVVLLNFLFDSIFLPGVLVRASSLSEDGGIRNEMLSSYGNRIFLTVRCKGSEPFSVSAGSESGTVGEFLNELGISYDEDDLLNVPADTALSDGMEIVVDEVSVRTLTKEEEIPFETVYREVDFIPRGTSAVVSSGIAGVVNRTYSVRLVNGNVESSELISESVVSNPVAAIAQIGVGGVYTAADGKTYSYSHYIDVTATAYGQNDGASGEWTYTGKRATWGVIAVDPNVIPLHTKVYVVGDYGDYGVNYAEDIGGGIKGKRIDICMDCSLEEMLQFGVRQMRVYFLD